MKKVLLHICCASCATVCIERLREEGLEVIGIFYNPNIHPQEEYSRREEDLRRLSKKLSLNLVKSYYNPQDWFNFIQGLEAEREGGLRCKLCFEFRLKKVREIMLKESLDFFTTTLTISPHKNSKLINEIGLKIDKHRFLVRDFKKKDGFKESVKCSKDLGLYRQNYCGCIFSKDHTHK